MSGECYKQSTVWVIGNALVSIEVVTLILSRAWIVPGWVTILGRVNHVGTEPSTQVNSASEVGAVSTQQKLGE